jgi:hypothetical protein
MGYCFMQKKLPFVFLVLSLIILCFSILGMVFGEMMGVVGVNRGDVFRYGYTCYFNSNDTNAVPPASFSSINQTGYFMINVTGVSGASVDFETTLHGLNGSNSFGVCSMNVGTGMASISGYGGPGEASNFYFMVRNVGMMGRMFPSSVVSPTINGTLMRNYAGVERLTNHFVTSTNQNGMIVNSDFYFDQATGMMVEWRQEDIQTTGTFQTNSTQMMQIAASSVWVVPEFPVSFSVPAFIVVASVLVLALLMFSKFRRSRPAMFIRFNGWIR